jgi:hypothetical protein
LLIFYNPLKHDQNKSLFFIIKFLYCIEMSQVLAGKLLFFKPQDYFCCCVVFVCFSFFSLLFLMLF